MRGDDLSRGDGRTDGPGDDGDIGRRRRETIDECIEILLIDIQELSREIFK